MAFGREISELCVQYSSAGACWDPVFYIQLRGDEVDSCNGRKKKSKSEK